MASTSGRTGAAAAPITLLFGPPRSGTTFLQKRLCQHCNGIGIYEPTGVSAYQGINAGCNPYDRIFSGEHPHIRRHPDAPVIVKEVQDGVMQAYLARQGHDLISWVNLYRLRQSRILWIFRDPAEVWRSIVAQGWHRTHHPLETYLSFYCDAVSCYETMRSLAPQATAVLSHERLIRAGKTGLHRIAAFAGLRESAGWSDQEDSKALYYQRVHYDPSVRELMEALDAHSSLHRGLSAAKSKPALDAATRQAIQARLQPLYARIRSQDLLATLQP
ncbi:MAG: hypothetical protein VKI83_03405 [Synechococcaceae cyanobacterium]|nr:hypothetical protein [Synechococcaceae cyanobacterium]